ncbi:MAG: PDDEXK nuclease domain-containing protein, partial [Lachnospiraceae bacterium]|nr:PDDEXK nuclease domain-containing protein [Lachnospiraceae bacterium]
MNDREIIESMDYAKVFNELKKDVRASQLRAMRSVNTELIMLYHRIGTYILNLQKKQGWGSKVIDQLSKDLKSTFPEMKGFSVRNLKYMRKFAEEYPDIEKVQQIAAQLPWFHIVVILTSVDNSDTRDFYLAKAYENSWSRNVLVMQIESKLHERQGKAVTNFKDKLSNELSDLAKDSLKDPYVFEFLTLYEKAKEKDIEQGLIDHVRDFLLEIGEGFSFIGNQYHLSVGGEDYYLDMLLYNVKLHAYVVVELKTGKFKPEYAGKLNFYLSAVDDLVKQPGDNPSIGLLLCKEKNNIVAEYALKDVEKPIGLASYKLGQVMPQNLQSSLPSVSELERGLNKIVYKQQKLSTEDVDKSDEKGRDE